jgi:hypothetical protein
VSRNVVKRMGEKQLNAVYSSAAMKRRYEVWFLRCGLADGGGAWWFRYLITNLGSKSKDDAVSARPAQVWATWFPRDGAPQSFIQGFPREQLSLSKRKVLPFYCLIAENGIEEGRCWGNLRVDGHTLSWKLGFNSNFGFVLSNKGWIGFSKSPHSDAVFSGEIKFDGNAVQGHPIGFGVQGHNCGYRHRTYWRWMHAFFRNAGGPATTLEALVYDLPLGMIFRKVVLWHLGQATILRKINEHTILNEPDRLKWTFSGTAPDGLHIDASIEGITPGIHRLPYTKTDKSGTFPVANASLAGATVNIVSKDKSQTMKTDGGAVLEMGGI